MGLQLRDRKDLWRSVEQSMFHFECQRTYGTERESLQRWLADPDSVPSLRAIEPQFQDWLTMIEGHTARGVAVVRVRIVDNPPTDYQRFERAFARENMEAGEVIYHLEREVAEHVGLLPAAGPTDWWLLDHNTVLVQPFNANARVEGAHLLTEPAEVAMFRGFKLDAVQAARKLELT